MRGITMAVIVGTVILAGCGSTPSAPMSSVAPGARTAALATDRAIVESISGNGKIGKHFTMFEHSELRLRANVSTPNDGPVTYKWETSGWLTGRDDRQEARFLGVWDGIYTARCILTDAQGQTSSKEVTLHVWAIPTPPPPPMPPHP